MDKTKNMENTITEIEQTLCGIKTLIDKQNGLKRQRQDIATIRNKFDADRIELSITAAGKSDADYVKNSVDIDLSGDSYDQSPGDLEYSIFKILDTVYEDLSRRIDALNEVIINAWNEK